MEPNTSVEALKTIEHKIHPAHEAILEALDKRPEGLTADEIAEACGFKVLFARPRVSELHKGGDIYKTDMRSKNASGLSAAVWRRRSAA